MRHTNNPRRSYSEAKLPDGTLITGVSRADLRRQVRKHLGQAQLADINNFDAFFENAICEALPPERCARECRYVDDDSPEELKSVRRLRLEHIVRFVRSMRDWQAAGGGLDSEVEAERRARICAQCPRNVDVAGCSWCSGLLASVLQLVAGRRTEQDHLLKHCDVCGCANRAAVHFPMSAVDATLDYPEWCWKAPLHSAHPSPAQPE